MSRTLIAALLSTAVLAGFSGAVQAQSVPKATLCTGPTSLRYFTVGQQLVAQFRGIVDLKVVESTGSIENLDRISDPKRADRCDMALTQGDALIAYPKLDPAASFSVKVVQPLYQEPVHFICNTDRAKGVDRVVDLMKRNDVRLGIGEPGAGTQATWATAVSIEKRYETVPTVPVGGDEGLSDLISGKIGCMIVVAGQNSRLIQDANEAAKRGAHLSIINYDDRDIKNAVYDGMKVYEETELPKSGNYYYLTGHSKPDTLSTPATLVVSQDWYAANKGRTYNDLLRAVRGFAPAN